MIILVLNCGSSSVKYQVINMTADGNRLLAKGLVERIGLTDGVLTHKPSGGKTFEFIKSIPDHTVGINLILQAIVDQQYGVITSLNDINAVGHRVAHGGEYFMDSVIVNQTVKQHIENCFELAPLHNPANLKGILAIENLMPTIQQVAVFDTSFHQTMPPKCYMYALPYRYYDEYKIRKYGFHGTSHKFVAAKAVEMVGLDINNSKIITCHIGNGASVTAILNGKSFDTSMGFTPADGLVMGTRCGTIDPGAIVYIADKESLNSNKLSNLINKDSGLYGITGISSDMRDIGAAAANGDQKAILAIDMFNYRIKQYIGSYAAGMGGVDVIVFTGGIGEHNRSARWAICEDMQYMGVEVDAQANEDAYGKDLVISSASSKVKVVVATTNEELVIASDTYRLLKKK